MNTFRDGYHGLSLVISLNWDRIIFPVAVAAALSMGAWVGGL